MPAADPAREGSYSPADAPELPRGEDGAATSTSRVASSSAGRTPPVPPPLLWHSSSATGGGERLALLAPVGIILPAAGCAARPVTIPIAAMPAAIRSSPAHHTRFTQMLRVI